jgi:hypothetical protein
VKAIEPSLLYPTGKNRYTLNIIGEGFTEQDLPAYAIRIGEEQVRFQSTGDAQNHPCPGSSSCLDFINPGTLQLRDFETQSVGDVTFRLWTGTQWTEPFRITLSRVKRKTVPWISLLALAFAVFFVSLIAMLGSRGTSTREFLIDKKLGTYSVATFQFLLWSVILTVAYVHRCLTSTLVQGRLEIPEIPSGGFATLMGISASTMLLSLLIGRKQYPAGAAIGNPAFSDLVRQFHIIKVERAQFATWTMAMAYFVVWRVMLPRAVPEQAAIPPIFLWLMGISAATYLCGKLVRHPGPVLREASAKPDEMFRKLRFEILGSNFSPLLRFKIDGSPIQSAQCRVSALESEKEAAVSPEQKATSAKISPAERDRSNGFVLEILSAQDAWLEGTHTLGIFNADNQSVDAEYTGLAFISRPLIAEGPVPASQDWVPVVLTGLEVADDTLIQWHDAAGIVSSPDGFRRLADTKPQLPDSSKHVGQWITPVSTIKVSLRPGLTTGTGCLVFLPKNGKRFAVPVEVQ